MERRIVRSRLCLNNVGWRNVHGQCCIKKSLPFSVIAICWAISMSFSRGGGKVLLRLQLIRLSIKVI